MAVAYDGRGNEVERFFAGHVCCVCGFKAQRWKKGQYYCADHYPEFCSRKVREARAVGVRRGVYAKGRRTPEPE